MKKYVAGLFEKIDALSLNVLKKKFHKVVLLYDDENYPKEKIEVAIIRSRTRVDSGFLDLYPNLKYVVMLGVGRDNIDEEACKKRGIKVLSSKSGNANAVSEMFFMHMINALRHACEANYDLKRVGSLKGIDRNKYFGHEVKGKTIGFVGVGAISQNIIKKLLPWGVNVLGYDIVINEEMKNNYNVRYVNLKDLFSSSDIISINVPLLPSTYHMINAEVLNKAKPGVIIINLSRGGVVDERAMLKALKEGRISFYSTDVLEAETNHDEIGTYELIKHKNVFITPHISGQTHEALRKIIEEVVREVV